MKALVLGGSGFIGRRLVHALLEGGHDVTVLNRGRTANPFGDRVAQLTADRTDIESMTGALQGTKWDAAYDVSGFVMVAGGSDIDGLLDLLDGAVDRYVYVSSIMAYDQSLSGVFPWTEDLPANPEGSSSYGGFKAIAERAMLERAARDGFPVVIVRPAAVYGPENNIFDMEAAMFLRLAQRRPILLPHSGLVTCSYGHVDDLCELMLALPSTAAGVGEVFNVTAEAVTSERYVDTLAEIVGAEPIVVRVPDDLLATVTKPVFGHLFGRRHHAVLSVDKARTLLGFQPRYDFRSGHEHTFEWFRATYDLQRAEPLVDPLWRATWDFEAEAAVAAELR